MDTITKFMYKHFLNGYNKTRYRNCIADIIYKLKASNVNGCNDKDIAETQEFYKWLCENQ